MRELNCPGQKTTKLTIKESGTLSDLRAHLSIILKPL